MSSLAVLIGAELNAEIEHSSPYGKDLGDKAIDEKKKVGAVDADLPPAVPAPPPRLRLSDWVLGGIAIGEAAVLTYVKLRDRFRKIHV